MGTGECFKTAWTPEVQTEAVHARSTTHLICLNFTAVINGVHFLSLCQ